MLFYKDIFPFDDSFEDFTVLEKCMPYLEIKGLVPKQFTQIGYSPLKISHCHVNPRFFSF
jgi:hypothetical protein